jgi:hypothetical protein
MSCATRGRLGDAARHFREAAARDPVNTAYTRGARIANHWLLWPLRIAGPAAGWTTWMLFVITLAVALVAGGRAWEVFSYALAVGLYVLAGYLAVIALPMAKE